MWESILSISTPLHFHSNRAPFLIAAFRGRDTSCPSVFKFILEDIQVSPCVAVDTPPCRSFTFPNVPPEYAGTLRKCVARSRGKGRKKEKEKKTKEDADLGA